MKLEMILPDDWREPVRFRLLEPLEIAGYRVPAGFVTDGASVPRFFWRVFPPIDRYFPAAVVHDYALERGLGWAFSNDRFDHVLSELKVKGWRRRAMVAAVRLNGLWQHVKHWLGRPSRYVN